MRFKKYLIEKQWGVVKNPSQWSSKRLPYVEFYVNPTKKEIKYLKSLMEENWSDFRFYANAKKKQIIIWNSDNDYMHYDFVKKYKLEKGLRTGEAIIGYITSKNITTLSEDFEPDNLYNYGLDERTRDGLLSNDWKWAHKWAPNLQGVIKDAMKEWNDWFKEYPDK